MEKDGELVLMNKNRVQRTLKRMAYQIAEDNRSSLEVAIAGIDQRGYVTASHLAGHLSAIYDYEIECHRLETGGEGAGESLRDLAGEETYLLVVDDVIFSGHTMFKALHAVNEIGDFHEIHSAFLVDRGHRKYPIAAQFVGLELSTKLSEHVSVVVENGEIQKVVLRFS